MCPSTRTVEGHIFWNLSNIYYTFAGTRQHPPNQYSFNKSNEYQQQLHKDLDKLLQSDPKRVSDSPTWAIEVSKEPSHGGQSHLFNKKLLAASQVFVSHLLDNQYISKDLKTGGLFFSVFQRVMCSQHMSWISPRISLLWEHQSYLLNLRSIARLYYSCTNWRIIFCEHYLLSW